MTIDGFYSILVGYKGKQAHSQFLNTGEIPAPKKEDNCGNEGFGPNLLSESTAVPMSLRGP